MICEKEPARPSTAATVVGHDPGNPGSAHPAKLDRRLKGDLDTIVMKALQKDPDRRYASADALADDIRRYLTGRLIQARPDTIGYRTRKFVERNRWAVGAAALVFASLLAGLGGTLSQARRATENARQAVAAQGRAEEVTAFLIGLFEANDPSVAQGDTITARELLERGVAQATAMTDRPELQATLFGVTGRVYHSLGNLSRAEELFRRALAAWDAAGPSAQHRDERARAMLGLGLTQYLRGHNQGAEQLYRQVLAMRPGEEPGDPIRREVLYHLFEVLHVLGRAGEAERVFVAWEEAMRQAPPATDSEAAERVLDFAEILGNRGEIRGDLGLIRRAQSLLDDALTTLESTLGPRHPDVEEALYLMTNLLTQEIGVAGPTPEVLARADSVSRDAVASNRAIYSPPDGPLELDPHPACEHLAVHGEVRRSRAARRGGDQGLSRGSGRECRARHWWAPKSRRHQVREGRPRRGNCAL